MSSADKRRKSVRLITDLPVTLRSVKDGSLLDERATAHDISPAGFRLETQTELAKDSMIAFMLELPQSGHVFGRGLVIWCKRETFARWAGIKVIEMSRADRRRLARMLNPDAVDWSRVSALAVKAVLAVTVVVAAQKLIFERSGAFGAMAQPAPRLIALLLMVWALRGLLRRDQR